MIIISYLVNLLKTICHPSILMETENCEPPRCQPRAVSYPADGSIISLIKIQIQFPIFRNTIYSPRSTLQLGGVTRTIKLEGFVTFTRQDVIPVTYSLIHFNPIFSLGRGLEYALKCFISSVKGKRLNVGKSLNKQLLRFEMNARCFLRKSFFYHCFQVFLHLQLPVSSGGYAVLSIE